MSQSNIPDNADLLMQLPMCIMHNFINKKKQKRAEGNCEILSAKVNQQLETNIAETYYYIKIKGEHVETLSKNTTLLRVVYPENTSYIFQGCNGVMCSFSFHKATKNLDKFQTYFSEKCLILSYDSENVGPQFKQKVVMACPDNIQVKDISNDGKNHIKKWGKNIGFYVGKISRVTKDPVSKTGKSITQRASVISQSSIGQRARTNWTTAVQKAAVLNDFMTNLFRPVKNKVQDYSEKLGQSFNESDIKIISGIRDYSYAIRDSLNEGECKALNQLPKQQENLRGQQSSAQLQ